MADCFSLPNATELVEGLRRHIKLSREGRIYVDIGSEVFCRQAADTIEQLLAENEKLKAERDEYKQKYLSSEVDATNLTGLLVQAVADIPTACGYCKWFADNGKYWDCNCDRPCENISGVNTQWEWRGVQEDTDEAD